MSERQQVIGLSLEAVDVKWADQLAKACGTSRSSVIKTAVSMALENPEVIKKYVETLLDSGEDEHKKQCVKIPVHMKNDYIDTMDRLASRIYVSRNSLVNIIMGATRVGYQQELIKKLIEKQ